MNPYSMSDASSSAGGNCQREARLGLNASEGRSCDANPGELSVLRRKPTVDVLGRSPDSEGAAKKHAASRFAFPGCSAEWLVKRRLLSQWRDRAGFAPASLLGP